MMMTGSIADALKAQYQDDHVNDAVNFVNTLAAKAPPEPNAQEPSILIPSPENRQIVTSAPKTQPGFLDTLDTQTAPGRQMMQDAAAEFRDTPGVSKYVVPGSSQLKLALGALDTIIGATAALGGTAATALAKPFVEAGILDANQVSNPEKAAADLRAMMDVATPEMAGLGISGPRVASGLATREALQVEGANAAARIVERGPAFADQGMVFGSGVDPTKVGKAVANAVDTGIAKAGQIAGGLGNPPVDFISASERTTLQTVSAEPVAKIDLDASAKLQLAEDTVRRIKEQFSPEKGFLPINVTGGKFVKTKSGEVVFEPTFQEPAYAFHIPPQGMTRDQWRDQLAGKMFKDVQDVVIRAKAGDKQAQYILSQARWYRDMRVRLRQEFGGLGDTFADLLGTTSAQTGVEQNWDNALEILRRFSRGEYDKEINAYSRRIASGEPIDGVTLTKMHKAGEFPLITKASGQLFNANSPTSMGALLDMFRDIKAGAAPKTPNFTGNLIGYSNKATIDVWAARYLRNAAGLPYIPPPAEKAVAGKHLVGSTLHDPKIGAEFGFGQEVFSKAASEINADGAVQAYDPKLGKIGEDDLQAVVWFIEKDKWTRNGWTSKAGEGGSLDFEASLAGSATPDRVKELRRGINKGFKAPPKRKAETEEAYAIRVAEAKTEYDADKVAMQNELDSLAAPLDRTVLGVSAERPNATPSNYGQAELAAEFDDVVRDDPSVEVYKLTNTYGRFMNTNERALDAEFVTRLGFDPEPLKRRLVEMGKRYDQDAVFMSKVLRDGNHPNARPGIEIYFKDRQAADFAARLSDKLTQYGIDGFTFVTDARQQDRVNVQAMAGGGDAAGVTGLRLQYIPEFDDAYDPAKREVIMAEKEDLFDQVVADLLAGEDGISTANVVYYDTEVFKRENYDAFLGRTGAGSRGEVRLRQQDRPDVSRPARRPAKRAVRKGTILDR